MSRYFVGRPLKRGAWIAQSLAAALLAACDVGPLASCTASDTVICDIQRPEDIELVPDSRWFLVSELGGASTPGHILAIDPVTKERRVLAGTDIADAASPDAPQCGPPPAALKPRGFHLSKDGTGELRLLVIAGTRIERFRVEDPANDIAVAWDGCIDIPPEIQANDVAGFADGGLVVSHMYDPPRTELTDLGFVFGQKTGVAMAWSTDGTWTEVPGTDAAFANGIQVDPKTSRIYISSMFTQRVIGVDRDGGNRRESPRGPAQIDNLSWSDDGRMIGVGHTAVPIYGTRPCRALNGQSCAFPFAVVALDPTSLTPTTLYVQRRGNIPGASVAALKEGILTFGTAFGDRMSRVNLGAR